MELSLQESAEVLLAIIVFSLIMRIVYVHFETLQNIAIQLISSWCHYGI